MAYSILVLNTGSTSTKLAVYLDQEKILQKEYSHSREFLKDYPLMADQLPMRHKLAEDFIVHDASPYGPFSAIVARGGILCQKSCIWISLPHKTYKCTQLTD